MGNGFLRWERDLLNDILYYVFKMLSNFFEKCVYVREEMHVGAKYLCIHGKHVCVALVCVFLVEDNIQNTQNIRVNVQNKLLGSYT